jgi:hypothetical protein
MRKLLMALALACAPAYADMVVRDGKDYIRISQAPCSPEVLAHIPPQFHDQFQKAVAELDGKQHVGCWMVRPDALVLVVYADGDAALIPIRFFNHEKGI